MRAITYSRCAAAHILWLSDLHFDAAPVMGHDPVARVDAAVDYVNRHHGDAAFCVISGDMVETAAETSYRSLRKRLDRLCVPWWPMTGNHDRRAQLRRHLPLPEAAMPGFVQYALEAGPVRVICLDSLWEGEDRGVLCADRLGWLEAVLRDAPERPSLVMLHHPPLPLGLPMLDPDRLENGEALLDLLEEFPGVRQICFGHVHRPVAGQVRGIAYAGLRSALYQAPPPVQAWTWETFRPAQEAPQLGVIACAEDRIGIQMVDFCKAELGLLEGSIT